MAPQLLDERQAAELLGVSRTYLQRHRYTPDSPPVIVISSRCIRYKLADIEKWIESRRRGATSPTSEQMEPIRRIREVR